MALTLVGVKPKKHEITRIDDPLLIAKATEYREMALMADELKTKMGVAKIPLVERADAHRHEKLSDGESLKSVAIPTKDGARVLISYSEKYKGLGAENIPALQEAFGDRFGQLVEVRNGYTFDKPLPEARIRKAIGDKAWEKLESMLTHVHEVVPRKGAPDHIAELYAEGEDEMASDMETFYDACVYAPSVKPK